MCTCYYFYLPPAERKGPHLKFKRRSYNLPSSAVDSSMGRGPSWVYILLIVPSFFFFFLTHLLLSFQWHELGEHRLSLFYGLVFLGWCHPIKSSAHRGLWNFSVTWTWLSVQSREGSSPEDGAKRDSFSIIPARKTTRIHCHPSKQSLAFHLFQMLSHPCWAFSVWLLCMSFSIDPNWTWGSDHWRLASGRGWAWLLGGVKWFM